MDNSSACARMLREINAHAELVLLSRCLSEANCWGTRPHKNCKSHINASLSRQPLVKGERLVRYEVNAVILPEGAELDQEQQHIPM